MEEVVTLTNLMGEKSTTGMCGIPPPFSQCHTLLSVSLLSLLISREVSVGAGSRRGSVRAGTRRGSVGAGTRRGSVGVEAKRDSVGMGSR